MPISKEHISSPLEAGKSILDAKQLPSQLTSALDYVSKRLARKQLHLSLIVLRNEVQIPSLPTRSPKPESPSPFISTSPAKSLFSSASFTRSLSRSSTSDDSSSSASIRSLSRTNWSSLPSSPKDRSATPSTRSPTPSTCQPGSPVSPNPYGISLMHADTLTPKAEKILRHIIAKAEKKFSIGSGWLSPSPLADGISCPMTNDLIRRSLVQNEIIYSSEGLTLLSLDHLYTFKSRLHTYSRTLSPIDFTSAVDELRVLVLAHNGRRITKGYLMRSYDWLGISLAALVDVNEGYKTAYGGTSRRGGIEVQSEEGRSPPPLLKTNFAMAEIKKMQLDLASGCEKSPASDVSSESGDDTLVQVGESAKGTDSSVEEVLREDRGPHRRGPATPNGFEDITPVTKGEWCFLMVGEGWQEAKRVAVETC